MIAIPELAMPKSRKVTTVCNGRLEVWTDYEQEKSYFLEFMMSAEGEERERAECVYIQLLLQSLYFAPTTYGNVPQNRLTLRSRNF